MSVSSQIIELVRSIADEHHLSEDQVWVQVLQHGISELMGESELRHLLIELLVPNTDLAVTLNKALERRKRRRQIHPVDDWK